MRTFTDNDYQDLKKEIEDYKTKNPDQIKLPAITFSFAGDNESQNFARQVMTKFHNDGATIQTMSAFNFGATPKKNFSVSNNFDDSLLIEIHPAF